MIEKLLLLGTSKGIGEDRRTYSRSEKKKKELTRAKQELELQYADKIKHYQNTMDDMELAMQEMQEQLREEQKRNKELEEKVEDLQCFERVRLRKNQI